MNTNQAKQISIHEYLRCKDIKPMHRYAGDVAYLAVYRGERTASLMVSRDGRLFHDWGANKAGTIVDLAMLFCDSNSVADALREIESTMRGMCTYTKRTSCETTRRSEKATNFTIGQLTTTRLIEYGESRCIPAEVLKGNCLEASIYAYEGQIEPYRYIAWPNRTGGYELRNDSGGPYAKRGLLAKDISIVGDPAGSTCLVFEGFFDYLSALTMGWLPRDGHSVIVLNSVSMVDKAIPILAGAGMVHLWLDNDREGHRAADKIIAAIPSAYDCSSQLGSANDVNEYLLFTSKKDKDNH